MADIAHPETPPHRPAREYQVVARRYRPQKFEELIGQEHVAQALSNAIATKRIGHAYLFIGARGTGKTSTARILAKALNCVNGPTATPCNECSICQSISAGDDVDVLEIDGASNNGIDEIRQLRQNANVRPSRARFKIYIIDEVHMLSIAAFNGLLKTLEEPPEHVKFIFCTTESRKIPITILSRCQRFDFAGISTRSIFERLRQIAAAEGVEAEPEALEIIARRAAGSMRDSQSLLEQLLAFAPGRITVADVHGMLGTAGDQRLAALVKHLVDRNAAAALAELDAVAHEGVDVPQLLEQLFGYFRDCMVAAVGCSAEAFLYASPTAGKEVAEAGQRLGLQAVLAAMQILDQTLSRVRVSTQGRVLAELALVRICQLEELDDLAGLITQLQSGGPVAAPGPPRPAAARPAAPSRGATPAPPPRSAGRASSPDGSRPVSQASSSDPAPSAASAAVVDLTPETAAQVWSQSLDRLSGMMVDQARQFQSVSLAAPNRLVVAFPAEYALARSACQRQLARFEQAVAEVAGQPVHIDFTVSEAAPVSEQQAPAPRPVSPHQRLREVAKHPMVSRAAELFGAQPVQVNDP